MTGVGFNINVLWGLGCGVCFVSLGMGGCLWVVVDEAGWESLFRGDMVGVALMYSYGGGLLIIGGWALLLVLFVVLELTRGLSRGALRG